MAFDAETAGRDLRAFATNCDWMDTSQPMQMQYADTEKHIYIEQNVAFPDVRSDAIGAIFIGRGSYYLGRGMLSPYTVIGRYCSLSLGVCVGAGNHHMDYLSTGVIAGETAMHLGGQINIDSQLEDSSFTSIGCDVWMGVNVVVLGGRRIGTGACIGAGTVVTKDIPPYAIAVGNPARVVRYRFSDEIIESLLRTQWWNLPESTVRALPFKDINASVAILEEIRAR